MNKDDNKKIYNVSIDITLGKWAEAESEDKAIEIVSKMNSDRFWNYVRTYGSVSIGDCVEESEEGSFN
tara:strand:- start:206 stop:409 length:204 start_codon:yes stop_codon:yes gene_type:complete